MDYPKLAYIIMTQPEGVGVKEIGDPHTPYGVCFGILTQGYREILNNLVQQHQKDVPKDHSCQFETDAIEILSRIDKIFPPHK